MAVLAVTFPDLAALLTTSLAAALPAGTYVGIVKPAAMAGRSVVIVRPGGGPPAGRVLRAQNVAFTVWAPTEEAASDLAEQVVTAVKTLQDVDDSGVSAADILSAPSPLIDDSLIPCRYLTAQLFIHGS